MRPIVSGPSAQRKTSRRFQPSKISDTPLSGTRGEITGTTAPVRFGIEAVEGAIECAGRSKENRRKRLPGGWRSNSIRSLDSSLTRSFEPRRTNNPGIVHMNSIDSFFKQSRRQFVGRCGMSLASMAFWSLMKAEALASSTASDPTGLDPMQPKRPHFAPKAKNVIFLFMVGGPSHLDMFDYKPALEKRQGEPIPESFIKGVKFAQITEKQPKLMGSKWKFSQHGQCGAYMSELVPHMSAIVDDIAFIRTLKIDDTNHFFAELQMHTGWRQVGRPSMGSWVTYGLGSESRDMPGFVVLQSGGTPRAKSGVYSAGFLPPAFQGVPLRSNGDPILNLTSPAGFTQGRQHRTIE